VVFDDSPLTLLGFTGLPFLPSGLLKAIPNVILTYNASVNDPKPNLLIKQISDDPIQPFGENIDLKLNITNIGDEKAWGMRILSGTADLGEIVPEWDYSAGSIDYEVRAFYIPQLMTIDPFSVFFGLENILLNISTYYFDGAAFDAMIKVLLGLLDVNNDGFASLQEFGLAPNDTINYLESGASITVDLSESTSSGVYVPFDNETAHFTNVTIINGTQIGNSSTNNETNAYTTDFDTWNIQTNTSGINHNVTLEFDFNNETSNVTVDQIDALGFTYTGYNNISIWENGTADFYIYNYDSGEWVLINELTQDSDNSTFKQSELDFFSWTDQFTIYNGDNDTANNTINITHYISGQNNTVKTQMRLLNNDSTLLQIDYFGMDYLIMNESRIFSAGLPVTYTDFEGRTIQRASPNSIYIGSQNISSLIITQTLQKSGDYTFSPGATANLLLEIVNNGSENAVDVNISLPVPGILTDAGNFSLNGNYIEFSIVNIGVGSKIIQEIEFIIPNSMKLPGAIISSNNDTTIFTNISDFVVTGNDIYIDAPITYESGAKSPYLIEMQSNMQLVTPATIPDINETFDMNYSIVLTHKPDLFDSINFSSQGISYFNFSSGYNLTISLGGASSGNIQKTINKTSYKGYLFPSIYLSGNNMSSLIRWVPTAPLQIGNMELTLTKKVWKNNQEMSSSFSMTRGEYLFVQITIENTGNLPIGYTEYLDEENPIGFSIIDNFGYNQSGFDLVGDFISFSWIAIFKGLTRYNNSGFDPAFLSLSNITLVPGENVTINYLLKGFKVGKFELGSTTKKYFFITPRVSESESFQVKIKEKATLIITYLSIALGVTLLLILGSIANKKKQKRALLEFMRRDTILYRQIQEMEKTYDEYLD